MKILVTGATGLIGSELVKILLKENHEVNYLTTSKDKLRSQKNYQGFYWNPSQNEIDADCIKGVNAIIHLAGASISKRWTTSYKKEILQSRLQTTHILYSLIKNNPNQVEHIISASGTAIYPDSYSNIYIESSQEIAKTFLGNVVVQWENAVDQFQELNLKITKIRTGVVYSSKGGALQEIIKPIKLGVGTAFGSGKQQQTWIHLTDIANLYAFVLNNQHQGVFNAVALEVVTNQELTEKIAKKLNKPLFLPNIPKWVMALILGDMHKLLFDNKNILSKRALELQFKFQYPTIDAALDQIFK
ncbi:MAG: hypothetical protein ACI9XR_002565 [Flavobacterium sp.]|jgi:uncharacterized protein (TIGR01777 family)